MVGPRHRQNAALNRLAPRIRVKLANGWHHPTVRAGGPYDLFSRISWPVRCA